jgi:hypothetical protein
MEDITIFWIPLGHEHPAGARREQFQNVASDRVET